MTDHPVPDIEQGARVRISGTPRVRRVPGARIVCGDDVVLNSSWEGYHSAMPFPVTLIADRPGAQITIGARSRLHGCCIHAWSSVTLGQACLVAAGAQILDAHGHSAALEHARLRTRVQDRPAEIVIGDYCWIGLGALVLKGVHLGEGCIVGAGAVVMPGEYPPFSLVAGVPARVVRTVEASAVLPEDGLDDLLLRADVTRLDY
ncbi:hypothetical protein TBR22_A08160 [Luteitalea sp. TBR-22]|uniref:acyltransferase n=1 Tax=Luteitalea sp. TBR-22 TaxID=2802971 RepID=UPI001AF73289|nr:acyltransferase [Luteitalea sp. TBR-22]BCS31614.1 hypothetical protein TBR22_A08160 [Luteitalea sp. TBR-22]